MVQRIKGEMTSQVVEAIALCEDEAGFEKRQLEFYPKDSAPYKHHLNLYNAWTTHKAELGEHKKVLHMTISGGNMIGCSCGMYSYPCDFSATKAERLLARE